MVDITGQEHFFVDKVPMFTAAPLHQTSDFPLPGVLACTVIDSNKREDGHETIRIDTQTPWGINSKEGKTQFEVFSEQLSETI